jgi:hypothetical protein
LEIELDTQNVRVFFLGDFSLVRNGSIASPKLTRIITPILEISFKTQHVTLDFSSTTSLHKTGIFLTLCANSYDVTVAIYDFELTVPDTYHRALRIDLNILTSSSQSPCCSSRNPASGDHAMLYQIVSLCDRSCVHSSVNCDVNQSKYVITDYLNEAVPYTRFRKSK